MKVADLYAMGMESRTAYELMPQICELLGIKFPPEAGDTAEITELDKFAYDSEEAFRRDQI